MAWGGGGGSWSPPKITIDSDTGGNVAGNNPYGYIYNQTNNSSGGSDGQGFSAFGMGGKSGALGKYDVLGKGLDDANPWLQADKERKAAEEEARKRAEDLYEKTLGINKTLGSADANYKGDFSKYSKDYLNSAEGLLGGYNSKINALSDQAKQQSQDATMTYTNVLQPEMKNAMEMAKQNAAGAMTLEEAGDPNNKIQRAVREMYDKLGQQERMRGQQDFGVLSALGAQGASQQFGAGAGPMTAGMQGQIYARGQEQAGNAYAAAQKRMYDLQQQGIERGFDQSNFIYDEGQKAQGTYADRIGQYQNLEHNYNTDQAAYRGELGGYAGDLFGANAAYNTDVYNMGMTGAGIDQSNAYSGAGRQQNALNQLYGAEQQASNNNLAAGQANNASKGQFISSIAQLFAGMSDEREKKNISSVSDRDIDEFLGAVKPKKFEYSDTSKPGTQPGQRVGFMMQDVQGTKLGDQMTRQGPGGELMYDKDNLNGILLAALKRDRMAA